MNSIIILKAVFYSFWKYHPVERPTPRRTGTKDDHVYGHAYAPFPLDGSFTGIGSVNMPAAGAKTSPNIFHGKIWLNNETGTKWY